MKKILIISTSYDEQKMIQETARILGQDPPEIKTTASLGQDAIWWKENLPEILVIRLPKDPYLQSQFFSKLRIHVPKECPLVLICDAILPGLMQISTIFPKVRIMKAPVDAAELFRGMEDLTQARPAGQQQASPRYLTNQRAVVYSSTSPENMEAVLKNLSATGAYFEAEKNSLGLKKEDLIRIQIVITGLRDYTFNCRVVWVRKLEGDRIGVGVGFVDEDTALEELLKGK